MSSSARCVKPLKGQVPEVWIRERSLSFESPVKVRLWVSWSVTHAFAFFHQAALREPSYLLVTYPGPGR